MITSYIAQFLRNPQLEEFCRQYNASTLAEIHSSFCNKDRIAAIIQKQRLISYPNGQDINGLIFLQNTDRHLKVSTSEALSRQLESTKQALRIISKNIIMIPRVLWFYVLLESKFNFFHVSHLLRLICLINEYGQKILMRCFLLRSCQTNAKVSIIPNYLVRSY